MTSDDDELDDASLKSMRAVWLSMRDEEPPAAGMSALLAAAAAKADELRAEPTWWSQLLAFLRRPPALAFATVMILIGGAVLVTRNTKDKAVDAMSADAPAEPRARDVVPTETKPPPVPMMGEGDVPDAAAPESEVNDVAGVDSGSASHVGSAGTRPKPKPQKITPKVDPKDPKVEGRFGGKARPVDQLQMTGDEDAPGTVDGPSKQDAVKDTGEIGGTTKAAEPPSPPEAPVIVTESANAPTTPPLEQLARQAESAATRGDCVAVRTLAARIKASDEGFYKKRLGKNAAVSKCF